jgi:rod shape-determining protein MreD
MKLTGPAVHTILIAAFAGLQSVFFKNGLIAGVTPDIALIILIFSANQQGSYRSQTSGFIAGLIQDFLSITPLGFHAFTRTLLAYLNGLFKGKLFLDPILMPVLLTAIGTLLKAVFGYLLLVFFSPEHAEMIFTARLGIEIGLNSLIAPFLFGLLKLAGIIKTTREAL